MSGSWTLIREGTDAESTETGVSKCSGPECRVTPRTGSIHSTHRPDARTPSAQAIPKRFLTQQCIELTERLDDAIAVTINVAPVRKQSYLPNRLSVTDNPAHDEARFERSVHEQWSVECEAAAGRWERIVAFQVNLPAKRSDVGLG